MRQKRRVLEAAVISGEASPLTRSRLPARLGLSHASWMLPTCALEESECREHPTFEGEAALLRRGERLGRPLAEARPREGFGNGSARRPVEELDGVHDRDRRALLD